MYESSKMWRALFGNEFPLADTETDNSKSDGGLQGGFTAPKQQRQVIPTRFAIL
jgi:hypothetical protein